MGFCIDEIIEIIVACCDLVYVGSSMPLVNWMTNTGWCLKFIMTLIFWFICMQSFWMFICQSALILLKDLDQSATLERKSIRWLIESKQGRPQGGKISQAKWHKWRPILKCHFCWMFARWPITVFLVAISPFISGF